MTCRICKKWSREELLHYALRHNVHASCGFERWGDAFLDKLPIHQWGKLPFTLLVKRGLLERVKKAYNEYQAKQNDGLCPNCHLPVKDHQPCGSFKIIADQKKKFQDSLDKNKVPAIH